MAAAIKVLSVAVASGRAGYVFISHGQLVDWGGTVKATSSPLELAKFAQGLILTLKPDVVVTEKCAKGSRKGKRSRQLIEAIAAEAAQHPVYDISVERPRGFQSKYEEASHLAKQFPELAGYLPRRKRRIFDFEPRNMIVFEAAALALQAFSGPAGTPPPTK